MGGSSALPYPVLKQREAVTGHRLLERYGTTEEQKHGRKPDPIEMFYIVHKWRDENKSWIDDATEELAVKISRELTSLVETHGEETSELMQQAYVAASSFAISFPTTLTFPAHSDIVPISSISPSSTVSVYIIFAVLLPPSIPATFVPPSANPTWRVYSNAQ
ncbi:uncharacterized protein A4U43_C08F23710 [Asparagus officinalis]|uniref:uncharacterized protein LOC109822579 n=1 Tax=Asparagus officinalis TaxID=4686 RepID=UPI00098E1964|nr:uncharacterized protein LOC109822579 [Asparagus officinalis]ONK60884.1 uncharacterized protein A4U43_C08F23710 [Asparagus officinalis]